MEEYTEMDAENKAAFVAKAKIGTGESAREVELCGRLGWMISALVDAGPRGVSGKQFPGVRVAAHVHKLRTEHLISIETEHVGHSGPFRGRHAVYRLVSPVTLVEAGFAPRGSARHD